MSESEWMMMGHAGTMQAESEIPKDGLTISRISRRWDCCNVGRGQVQQLHQSPRLSPRLHLCGLLLRRCLHLQPIRRKVLEPKGRQLCLVWNQAHSVSVPLHPLLRVFEANHQHLYQYLACNSLWRTSAAKLAKCVAQIHSLVSFLPRVARRISGPTTPPARQLLPREEGQVRKAEGRG